MNELLKLIADIRESNGHILDTTRGTRKVSDDEIGDINNNACDIHAACNELESLIEATLAK